MSTSKNNQYTLRIDAMDYYRVVARVLIYDARNQLVSSGGDRWPFISGLDQGLYTVRVHLNGAAVDKVIVMDKDQTCLIADEKASIPAGIIHLVSPKQYSSALLSDCYGSSHEYYTAPAVEWSQKNTAHGNNTVGIGTSTGSSLFVFLRFASKDKYISLQKCYPNKFFSDFEIVDEHGDTVCAFRPQAVEVDEQHGWAAYSADLPHGLYYLMYHGPEPRQVPIYVFRNWHTQFFLTLGQAPLFGTTRIFVSPYRAFDPYEKTLKYIDILLDKLQNQDYTLNEELISMTANGKFESPMLGLICSYIYLKGTSIKNDDLFRAIVQNMENVILSNNPGSPDIRALKIITAKHFSNPEFDATGISGAPMFRIGFEAILDASVHQPDLIPENSINDFVSENLCSDSPFTTFKPIPFQQRNILRDDIVLENLILDEPKDFGWDVKQFELPPDYVTFSFKTNIPGKDRFDVKIKSFLGDSILGKINSLNTAPSRNSWIKNSIVGMINTDEGITINDISTNLNISGNTVTRILSEWKGEEKGEKPKKDNPFKSNNEPPLMNDL
ncbi:MAG: hypothetical protein JWO03_2401 [Bacteroidetes bacterium]|nr:hypothetical protein [Bacteroidota bacterium]